MNESHYFSALVPLLPYRLFFIYNGKYDFYSLATDRYSSAPVLSRLQNPGLALEWDINTYEKDVLTKKRRLRFGLFHESNGQELEEEDLAEFEFQRDDFDEEGRPNALEFALAQVSRNWN